MKFRLTSLQWRVAASATGLLTLAILYLPKTISAGSKKPAYSSWSDYGGSPNSMGYSALKQINKSNVSQLKLQWFVPAPGPAGRFSFNPLVIDGVMYVVGKDDGIYALDATTGKQIWAHPVQGGQPTNRGFNHWISKDGKDQRLIFSVDGYLQELNMKTGELITSFGDQGRVDLRVGLDRDPATVTEVQSGTPGRVFENLLILGSAPGEAYASPPETFAPTTYKPERWPGSFIRFPVRVNSDMTPFLRANGNTKGETTRGEKSPSTRNAVLPTSLSVRLPTIYMEPIAPGQTSTAIVF